MFGFWKRDKSIQNADNLLSKITIFRFCENSGPFAYYHCFDYHIIFHNGSYSCNWTVGWDEENSFSQIDIPEKYVIHFLRTIKESVVSTWNGFDVSNDEVFDGPSVFLVAKLEKADIDLSMKGYASEPPNFESGAEIIVNAFNELLKRVGRSLEASKTKGETLYYVQHITKDLMGHIWTDTRTLKRPILKIGRDFGFDNFQISNNRISHSHTTDILMRDGRYFIVVRGTENRTFVNGTEIRPEEEVEIFPGTKFNILDEEFIFDSCKTYKKLLYAERLQLPPIEFNLPTNSTDIITQICNLEKLKTLSGGISPSEYNYMINELIAQLKKFELPIDKTTKYYNDIIVEEIEGLKKLFELGLVTYDQFNDKKDERMKIDTLTELFERNVIDLNQLIEMSEAML